VELPIYPENDHYSLYNNSVCVCVSACVWHREHTEHNLKLVCLRLSVEFRVLVLVARTEAKRYVAAVLLRRSALFRLLSKNDCSGVDISG
jgi:hypothetical protein